MKFHKTPLEGAYLIELERRGDDRGFFARFFCEKEFGAVGLETRFVQINNSLTGAKGDPERGRAIVGNRQVGLCLLCHVGPFPDARMQGTMAPDLRGAGSRSTEGQLRLRIVDASRINPATIMPPYYRVDGLTRVAPAFRGKPVLSAEQIEDVVAYLATLRD